MSLIVSEVYDALIEAGTSAEKARAAAGAIPNAEKLVTKEDLTELRAGLKADHAELRAELKGDHAGLKTELKEDIHVLKRDMAVLKLAFAPAVLALLVKLVFFP